MNFSITWTNNALNQLATIWMAAANRNAVTAAVHAIDVALAAAPHTVGTQVFDTVYEYTRPPLGVEYEVIDADCRVFVLSAWDTARGRPPVTGN